MPYNSSLTANSFQGLGLNSTLTSILAAQVESQILASIDYSDFSNFVFFNSAYRKVQMATTFILDNWPVGRTDGFFGTAEFQLDDNVSSLIDEFNTSATNYELYLLKKLSDPDDAGWATSTATLTANYNQSSSAFRTVVNVPRDEDKLLTSPNQNTFISNLLDDASTYDVGTNRINIQPGTASINSIGTQYFPSSTANLINRESQLINMIPGILYEGDNTDVLDRFVTVIAEVLDNLKVFIDQFASLRLVEYNKPNVPRGISQVALAELLGFKLINENLRQEVDKQLLRASITGDTSINAIVEELHERVLNNLIYILKTKGAKQSIEALIQSYGLPESFLSMREYATQIQPEPITYKETQDCYVLDYTNNTVTGDRLSIVNTTLPEFFELPQWACAATIEARIKFPTLSSEQSSGTSTFFSMIDRSEPYGIGFYSGNAALKKIKLFYTDGQLHGYHEHTILTNPPSVSAITVSTPIGLSGVLKRTLSTEFVNVTLRINTDDVVLNAFYPDIINGRRTITSISSSVNNSITGDDWNDWEYNLLMYRPTTKVLLGGEMNSYETTPRIENVNNLFQGQMQEVRIWADNMPNLEYTPSAPLADEDLISHTNDFQSITTEYTDAANKVNLSATVIDLSDPYSKLSAHWKLKENIKKDMYDSFDQGSRLIRNSGNFQNNMAFQSLMLLGATATQDLYSKVTLQKHVTGINDGGLLFNIDRSTVSGETSYLSIHDSRLISIVADPIKIINQNIINVLGKLKVGNLYGTASAQYNNIEYEDASPYIQNWYKAWPQLSVSAGTISADYVGNSLLFKGIKNYQKTLENLQDVFYSIILTTKQLLPAHSHLFESGMLIKSHLLNRSRQPRLKDSITSINIFGNVSTNKNSITANEDGLLNSGKFLNSEPAYYNTNIYNYSLNQPNVTGLTKTGSVARAFVNNFGVVSHPIEFFPTYPDKTKINSVFDRVLVSPTGGNSIVTCSLKLLSNGRRIKTTNKAVKIIFPSFTDQTLGLLGVSKLIVSVNKVNLPRAVSEYEFPITDEDGVSIVFTPTPEFQQQILTNPAPPDTQAAATTWDVEVVFVNLITQEKTSQILSYSTLF